MFEENEKVHRDISGNKLAIGDKVVCIHPSYRSLILAEIIGLTPKMVKVKWTNNRFGETETIRHPSDCHLLNRSENDR